MYPLLVYPVTYYSSKSNHFHKHKAMKFIGMTLVLFAIFYAKSVQSIELVDSMEFRTALCSDCGMRFTGTVSLKVILCTAYEIFI